jgi:hypothetical protein
LSRISGGDRPHDFVGDGRNISGLRFLPFFQGVTASVEILNLGRNAQPKTKLFAGVNSTGPRQKIENQ